jgi:hypothetical protein
MLANRGQLPPHLLAPEVAAAARDVVGGHEFDPIGLRAIQEAREQLKVERDAIEAGSPAALDRAALSTALAQSGGSSLHLAALALNAGRRPRQRLTPQAQIEYATSRLDEIIADLEEVENRDRGAAERIDELFDTIGERVLAPSGAFA